MRRAWVLIAITATGCGGAGTRQGPPTSFAPNRGQFARDVRFAAQGAGYALAAKDGGLELALNDRRVHVAIPGRPRAGAALPGKASYFLGDLRRTNVPTYAGVAYEHAWPGVDVAVYGTAGPAQATESALLDAFVTQLETTITARPPAQTPDQIASFRFARKMPGQIDPAAGISFGCRVYGGAFSPCASPFTTKKLSLAEHTFEVRAVISSGVADPAPAAFTFRITQPRPEVKHYACALEPVGAYHDRGTRDWAPCDREIVCPREAVCLLDLAVDEHDDSYLFNHDVHLQHFEDGAYKDREYCFAPPLSTPVNPKLEVRFDPRRGEHNRHHACHADGALGLADTSRDNRLRFRCSGSGHSPKPGGDRTTGDGFEDNAHLRCDITATIQRHATEFGETLVDGPSPNLLVYTPQPASVLVSVTRTKTVRASAKRAGAVRVPLKLTAAASKLRRKRALTAKLTITFQPSDGPTLTSSATVKLKRAAARRPARTRAAARRSAGRSR